jgi:hypothetical protein
VENQQREEGVKDASIFGSKKINCFGAAQETQKTMRSSANTALLLLSI